MPLFPISPNIQELDSTCRKRTHEEFIDDRIQLAIDEPSHSENLRDQKSIAKSVSAANHDLQLPPGPVANMDSAPESSPLTEPGSSPSPVGSPSPNHTSSTSPQPNSTKSLPTQPKSTPATQPAKRKMTAAEREQERAEKRRKKEEEAAEKLRKKEVEAAEKAAKKAADEAAKAAKAAEKEERDAARLAKKAETEAKKRERELKDAKKAEEKRKKEEQQLAAQRKQEKQKNMLASFVKKAPATPSKKPTEQAMKSSPKPDAKSATPKAELKPPMSAYEQTFQPFFVKPDVTLAPQPFEMDEETKEAKSEILDQYIRGERGPFNPKPFNPTETFNIAFPQKRGVMSPSVKKIMENIYGDPLQRKFDVQPSRTESQTEKLVIDAQGRLDTIPMKYLSFYEDVRPPYCGTITTPMTIKKLRTLCCRPAGKLLTLNYDYDSEAEWVEDDGEDLDDDDDDEESNDGEGEMEDFLDDSDDVPVTTRPTFRGDVEPTSTGICFEDRKRLGPCASMYKYRLEFVLGRSYSTSLALDSPCLTMTIDTLEHHSGIDPFSSSYWPAPVRKKPVSASTLLPPASTSMPPPSAPSGEPTDTFSRLVSLGVDAKDLVPKAVFEEFTQAITSEEFRDFTKVTLVDLLARKFPSCTKSQIKFTLDKIAHRISVPGAKKSVKVWAIAEF
ncbi:hypothetical protein F5Y13DRAFT_17861 [Hypoxylon sp. FL1857]|nr:hypothetical protein F5Y13DRAFT_17861 [Hypoxylon sp. FL1857]